MEEKRYTLPYMVSLSDLFILLDEIKNRPNSNENDLRMRAKNFRRTKSALIELGLIQVEGTEFRFTDVGKAFAWGDESEKSRILLADVILQYEPYEVVLTHAIRDVDQEMESDYVQKIWGQQLGIQLSAKNRSAAVSTFFQLLDYSRAGSYKIGRHGKSTRIANLNREKLQSVIDEQRGTRHDEAEGGGEDTQTPTGQSPSVKGTADVPIDLSIPRSNRVHFKVEHFFDLYIEKSEEAFNSLDVLLPIYKQISGLEKQPEHEGDEQPEEEVLEEEEENEEEKDEEDEEEAPIG